MPLHTQNQRALARPRALRPQLKRDPLGGVLSRMTGYNFSDEVRRALHSAREEAAVRGHHELDA